MLLLCFSYASSEISTPLKQELALTLLQVLIDGDASYFHESFIEGGEKGGLRAAAELHSEIKQHVETLFPGTDLPIMLHMYANLGGLSGLYARNGVIASPSQLFVFARGFNSSQDMFNLVDVGTGKEGADHKARGVSPFRNLQPYPMELTGIRRDAENLHVKQTV